MTYMRQDDHAAVARGDHPAESPPTASLEIANGIARLHKEFIGRGPANTRVTVDGDVVVAILEGGFTRAEETLEASDRDDIVAEGRRGLQEAMRVALIAAVETTLGRRVRSFMSANDLRHNIQCEVFVLHRESVEAPPEPEQPADVSAHTGSGEAARASG